MKGDADHNYESCRKTARNLLTQVDKLVDRAGQTRDAKEKHELYLRAMGISNEAYSLLAKAREIKRNSARAILKL